MQLQTQVPIKAEQYNPIDYDSKLLLLGSCFAENIGEKFNYFKFQTTLNPFGILFHPKAIETLIVNAINQKEYAVSDLFHLNERYHCFDAHSKLSQSSESELINTLNKNLKITGQQLNNSTHIIITLGTAWVYRFIEDDEIVANCHKVLQKQFLKELLSIDDITESLESIISLIRSVNPKVNIMFTVSPVRHLKDGFVENTQSKAHLISALHQVVDERDYIHYFPSYEIMMDELRDYRFYEEDMIHPNNLAINYIWKKFKANWIDSKIYDLMSEVSAIQKGLSHKPLNQNSLEYKKFIQNLEKKKFELNSKLPFIKFN